MSERDGSEIQRLKDFTDTSLDRLKNPLKIQIQTHSMSNPILSDIHFEKNDLGPD